MLLLLIKFHDFPSFQRPKLNSCSYRRLSIKTIFKLYYYTASSTSGQNEPNWAIWLATQVGKMKPSCPLGTSRCIPQEKFPQKPYNKSFINQVCLVKMAGYWPRSFFASLWTPTSSWSINTQKQNLTNIQPSWHHIWIQHIFQDYNVNIVSTSTEIKVCFWLICIFFNLLSFCLFILRKQIAFPWLCTTLI